MSKRRLIQSQISTFKVQQPTIIKATHYARRGRQEEALRIYKNAEDKAAQEHQSYENKTDYGDVDDRAGGNTRGTLFAHRILSFRKSGFSFGPAKNFNRINITGRKTSSPFIPTNPLERIK
ncbi:hypothetical protein BofuT4_P101000.1 [Botrytis cinerea T4]|uniref:Uncharacterized protein n=1 Tax=Botryotinia fuckeliana (strain T4) TaxID=999810 RepID=G2YBV5_BOTF4|nr:hypothetical protein BofuT4_P101000.1 [Botrytis cinerea T4]